MENFVEVSKTATSISVSWNIVTEDIDSYVITYTDNVDSTVTSIKGINRNTSQFTIENLKSGRSYTITIYTVKDSNAGPESTITTKTGMMVHNIFFV